MGKGRLFRQQLAEEVRDGRRHITEIQLTKLKNTIKMLKEIQKKKRFLMR